MRREADRGAEPSVTADKPRPAVALTIAGFDPSSGAGVTADLQVFAAHGMFGTAAVTALTVQSTQRVSAVESVRSEVLAATLAELQADIPAVGIKIGMLGSEEVVRTVASFLRSLQPRPIIVLDPVLRSSTGSTLLTPLGIRVLQEELLPLVDVVTPNWAELAVLSGTAVESSRAAENALAKLGAQYARIVAIATGGDQPEPVDCLRLPDGSLHALPGVFVETTSTHGTGCAFSSALLCGRLRGLQMLEAAIAAKHFVEGALRNAPGLGRGRGPMDLLWPLRGPFERTPVL